MHPSPLETKASSLLLLLQIFQQPKQSFSPNMLGQVVQLWEALFSPCLLAREFQNQTYLFRRLQHLQLGAHVPPPGWNSQPLLLPSLSEPQQTPHSSVQMSLETLPALLVTNSFTLEEWGACPHLKDYLDWWTVWIESRMGIPKYLGAKKPQVIKAVDGRVFKVSVFLHPHMSEPDTALQNGKQFWFYGKFSIIQKIQISSCSLHNFKRQ